VYPTEYSWGIDRIDQPDLPLSNGYSPAFKGCGVDIYVIDSGIDTDHIEFIPVSGTLRRVQNIFNPFGNLSSNTDGYGHGTHCAGTVCPILKSAFEV
jgi:serine protease